MTVTVRFAPSPTGHIHIGNTRTALFNWLVKLRQGGTFILRFDDTDTARSRQDYADQIAADLAWLGITPDRVEYQSARMDRYRAAAQQLIEAGLLYACYETADEIERKRKILLSRRLPPVYGREALKLTDAEREAFKREGRQPHWRFLLPNHDGDPFVTKRTEIHWDDLVRGPQTVDLSSLSDPVLVREDGTFLYTLPSVVDDIEFGITDVIRGDDHVTNTGVQMALFAAFGAVCPRFGHHNLLTTATGEGLSKRSGALSVKSLAESGYEPMSVASLAVLTGSSAQVEAVPSIPVLAERFEIAATSKSAAKFDPADLDALNAPLVHGKAFADARHALHMSGVDVDDGRAEAFWLAVRDNCAKVGDAAQWWRIVTVGPDETVATDPEDLDFCRLAFDHFPDGEVTPATWKVWTEAAKLASGRKGRALFMPLRIALTGRASGPELADLLPFLGREEILRRRP